MTNELNCAGFKIWNCEIPSEKTCYFYIETGLYYISFTDGARYSPPLGTGKGTFSSGMQLCEIIQKLIDLSIIKREDDIKELEDSLVTNKCNNNNKSSFKHREYAECGESYEKYETCIIDNLIYVSLENNNRGHPIRGGVGKKWAGGFDEHNYIKHIISAE